MSTLLSCPVLGFQKAPSGVSCLLLQQLAFSFSPSPLTSRVHHPLCSLTHPPALAAGTTASLGTVAHQLGEPSHLTAPPLCLGVQSTPCLQPAPSLTALLPSSHLPISSWNDRRLQHLIFQAKHLSSTPFSLLAPSREPCQINKALQVYFQNMGLSTFVLLYCRT